MNEAPAARRHALAAKAAALLCALALLGGGQAAAGETPTPPVLIRADIFAREGADILYALGNVHLERGDAVITCDAAVIWTAQQEAYLEGHILYRTGKSVMEAERAYVRWAAVKDELTGAEKTKVDRGFLFNAVIRWSERPDQVTWQVRAEEVLQTDVQRFLARGGLTLSPCQFHEPHAFFRASEVELVTDERLIANNLTYHVRGVSLPPIWLFPIYWPKLYVPLGWQWPEFNIEVGNSSRFGFYARTEIIYEIPERLFGTLRADVGVNIDYFSKRGFAYGGSLAYESQNRRDPSPLGRDMIRGRFDAYRVPNDKGQDYGKFDLGTTDRYRVRFFHTHDFPSGLELDLEYQYYTDAGFRQEYFPVDYETGKPMENRAYLKYPFGPAAAYAHVRLRNEKWLDSTEYLPQIGLNVFSYPILGNLLYTGHVEFAHIRRRLSVLRLDPGQSPFDPEYERKRRKWNFFYDGDTSYPILPLESTPQEYMSDGRDLWRLNTYHQLALPFDLSIFHIEPFVGFRGTYYSDTLDGGSDWRSIFAYGGRISTQFWRSWDDVRVHSPLLELQGVRHVITPEIRYLSIQKPSVGVDELILTDDTDFYQPPRNPRHAFPARPYRPLDTTGLAFGDLDAITPVSLVNFSFLNRWQTRRGGNVVDFLSIDPNITFYTDSGRDNWGRSRGDWSIDTRFVPVHGLHMYLDFGERVCGDALGRPHDVTFVNSGLAIELSERWALFLSHRVEDPYSNQWAARLIYQINNKWRVDAQYETNTERGYDSNTAFRLTRDLHDWIIEFVFQNDESGLNNLVGVSLQPKGRRELISGLEYTRDLRAGLNAYQRESYQQFDY